MSPKRTSLNRELKWGRRNERLSRVTLWGNDSQAEAWVSAEVPRGIFLKCVGEPGMVVLVSQPRGWWEVIQLEGWSGVCSWALWDVVRIWVSFSVGRKPVGDLSRTAMWVFFFAKDLFGHFVSGRFGRAGMEWRWWVDKQEAIIIILTSEDTAWARLMVWISGELTECELYAEGTASRIWW